MNELVFQTGGDWASTTLHDGNVEVPAAQLLVVVKAGRDDWDNPTRGGIGVGVSELTAYVRPQDDPDNARDVLPGRITLRFPEGVVTLENFHPLVEPEATRVTFNGEDVSDRIVDVYVDVNALDDVVKAFVTLYKSHWFGGDEAVTHVLVA